MTKLRKPRRPTPEKWISGPDPQRHQMFEAWHKHRSQARYRGEPYELTFEDFEQLWGGFHNFACRGKKPQDLCMTRKDFRLPWMLTNCEIITRYEQLCREALARVGKPRKKHLLNKENP